MAKRTFGSGWERTEKAMQSDFISLKADKDSVDCIFLADPFFRMEKGVNGAVQTRAYFPIITSDGLRVWGVGKIVLEVVKGIWSDSVGVVYTITRHGIANDPETTYTVVKKASQPKTMITQASDITEADLRQIEFRVKGQTQTVSDDEPS